MSSEAILAGASLAIFCFSLYGLIVYAHLLRKIMAVNIMGSAVFLFLGAIARRNAIDDTTDPIPQAMVITGIVVAVSATAFAIALARRIYVVSGQTRLPEEGGGR